MSFFKRIFKKKLPEKEVVKEEKEKEKIEKLAAPEGGEPRPDMSGREEKPKKILAEKEVEQKLPVSREQKPVQKLSEKATRIAPRILVRPIITEKATFGEAQGVYTFEIAPGANKISVKQAIKELYNVDPIKVRIVRTKGKQVRYGRSVGKTKDRKKAMVQLKSGDKIEFAKKQ